MNYMSADGKDEKSNSMKAFSEISKDKRKVRPGRPASGRGENFYVPKNLVPVVDLLLSMRFSPDLSFKLQVFRGGKEIKSIDSSDL